MKTNTMANKSFILMVIGQIISLFGNGILRFALPLYLLNKTGSSAVFGIVSAVSFLPLVLLMPVGGIVADRANKRNIMVMLDFATGVLMLFFYFALNILSLVPLLIATLMVLYSITGLYQPVVQASVPMLLEEKVLARGNGIVSSIGALANLLSPIIGGFLFAHYSITPIVIVSIVCFFMSAITELFIKLPYKKNISNTTMPRMVKEDAKRSIDFIFKEKPTLKKLMLVTCLINALVSALIIIALPVLITERLNLSEEMYGLSQGVLAFGGLFGGVMTGIFGKKGGIQKLPVYCVLIALSLAPMAVAMFLKGTPAAAYGLILAGAFLTMCVATIVSVTIITYIQSQTEENMVGKVMAFVMTVSMLASPLGQAMYGVALEVFAGYESFVILAAVLVSVLVGFYARNIAHGAIKTHDV